MEMIDREGLRVRTDELRQSWEKKSPFKYLVIADFLESEAALVLTKAYPSPFTGEWDRTTYINQGNKYTRTEFEPGSIFRQVFDELNSEEFLDWVEEVTGIPGLVGDSGLSGGGLHQSINGAFLDIHVDFNLQPKTRYHRRINILVYLNKDWQKSFNGYLEFWDMNEKKMIEEIRPDFNLCVLFETNDASFHGHPRKLDMPDGVTRKSLAAYYYTRDGAEGETASEHNTIYRNTEGMRGMIKNLDSGFRAFWERARK